VHNPIYKKSNKFSVFAIYDTITVIDPVQDN